MGFMALTHRVQHLHAAHWELSAWRWESHHVHNRGGESREKVEREKTSANSNLVYRILI